MIYILNNQQPSIIIENWPKKTFLEHNLVVAVLSVLLTLITQYVYNRIKDKKDNNIKVLNIVNAGLQDSLDNFIKEFINIYNDAFSLLVFTSENKLRAININNFSKDLVKSIKSTSLALISIQNLLRNFKNELNSLKKYFDSDSEYSSKLSKAIEDIDCIIDKNSEATISLFLNFEHYISSENSINPNHFFKGMENFEPIIKDLLKPTYEDMFPSVFELISETQQTKYTD